MPLGEYIKQLRQKRGLSLDDVKEAVGVDKSITSRIESGNQENIKLSHLAQFARAYQVHPMEIFLEYLGEEAPEEWKAEASSERSAYHRAVQAFLKELPKREIFEALDSYSPEEIEQGLASRFGRPVRIRKFNDESP